MQHILEISLIGIPLIIAILNFVYRDRNAKPALLLWLLSFAIITAVVGVVIHFDKAAKLLAGEKRDAERAKEFSAQNESMQAQLSGRIELLKESLAALSRSSRLLLSNNVNLARSAGGVPALISSHTEAIDRQMAEVRNLLSSTNSDTEELLRDRCRNLEIALSDYQSKLSLLVSTNPILGNSLNTDPNSDRHDLAALKEKFELASQELETLKQKHALTFRELTSLKQLYDPALQELAGLKKTNELTFQLHTNFIHTALSLRRRIMEEGGSGPNTQGLNTQLRDSIFFYHNRLLRLQPCGQIAGPEGMRVLPR